MVQINPQIKLRSILVVTVGTLLLCSDVYATYTLGDLSKHLSPTFGDWGRLIVAIAFMSGLGFGIAAVYKFKQYKDNPTQIPIGTPFALLFVSIILVFFPAIIRPTAMTLFGKDTGAAGFTGDQDSQCRGLPGGDNC